MKAEEVRDALRRRWPESEYLHIGEAPTDAMRQGRKLDVLVASLWRSRGYELDGVEIKVSVADWRRELANAHKADWWWSHVHRFWVAVPLAIAPQVRAELPSTWGLLAVSDKKTAEVVKALKHDAEPLPWGAAIGLLRAASDAGWGMLQRAEARGREEGERSARRAFERITGDAHLRAELDDLKAKVAAFTEASGVDIAEAWGANDAARLGQIVGRIRQWIRDPATAGAQLRRDSEHARDTATRLAELADELDRTFVPEAVSS